MAYKITQANMDSLKDAASSFAEIWDDIADAVETWIDLSAQGSLSADERESKKEAREEFEGRLDEIGDAIESLIQTWRSGSTAAKVP